MQVSTLRLRPLMAALAMACGASAWADDPNPYYVGVSQAFTHDSNVTRTIASQAKSDNYWTSGVLAGIDQPFGRQRFYGNGSVRYSKFGDQSQLDNASYALTTGLDLSTIEHISGGIKYRAAQDPYYGGTNTVAVNEKNLVRSQDLSVRGSWGGMGRWSIDATGSHQSQRYSSGLYASQNLDQNMGSLGTTYRPSGLLSLGVAYRLTHAKYPSAPVGAAQSFNRNDIDFTTSWIPTGQSTINARLSYGKLKYDNALNNNSIASGSLAWDYRPTGKLGFNLWVSRDTGAASSFFSGTTTQNSTTPTTFSQTGDNSQRTTSLALSSTYAATGKINVNASARYARRSLTNTNGITVGGATQVGSLEGVDVNRVYSIGASYAALRSLLFACNVTRDARSASGVLSYPYTANVVGCSAQFTLQ